MAVIIHNEQAYYAAVNRHILANARKTFIATHPDAEAILEFIAAGRTEEGRFRTYAAGFVGSLAKAFDDFGKLTPKQVEAVRKMIADRAARKAEWANKQAALNATRQHLGTVGEKITLTLTIKKIIDLESLYGWTALCICEDEAQNVVIYKGKSKAFDIDRDNPDNRTITITAIVAAHGVRDGVKQTIIQRPKAA